jgi:hypothetical protein
MGSSRVSCSGGGGGAAEGILMAGTGGETGGGKFEEGAPGTRFEFLVRGHNEVEDLMMR